MFFSSRTKKEIYSVAKSITNLDIIPVALWKKKNKKSDWLASVMLYKCNESSISICNLKMHKTHP